MEALKRLIDYKSNALQRAQNPRAEQAIQYEIKQLREALAQFEEQKYKLKQLSDTVYKLENEKKIAETVALIHGVSMSVLNCYYRNSIEDALDELELTRELKSYQKPDVPLYEKTIYNENR